VKTKSRKCPSCGIPLYERVPACPNCRHEFYDLEMKNGWDVYTDLLTSPVKTTERYASGAFFKGLLAAPLAYFLIVMIWPVLPSVLLAPVSALIPWEKVFQSLLTTTVVSGLAFGGFLLCLSVGLNLVKKPLDWKQLVQVVCLGIIPATGFLIPAILFRIINIQSVTFQGSPDDLITAFLSWTFVSFGHVWGGFLVYRGISSLTGLSGIQAFLLTFLLPGLVVLLLIVILSLFLAGILWG